jgi:hypothetical protein
LKNYIKRNKKYYVLRTNKEKNKQNITIKVEDEILEKIISVNVFYTFCFLVIASKSFKYKKDEEAKKKNNFLKLLIIK